ncbi:MAG: M14 family metallopeptidase [bacterium]|nr:M14 family metallopeptidase [bacterium]
MRSLSSKQVITAILIVVLIGGLLAFAVLRYNKVPASPVAQPVEKVSGPIHKVIGTSVQGRAIDSYTYLPAGNSAQTSGTGDIHLAFVGGIHGGYEWNSVSLAYKFMDYLKANQEVIPKNITVSVIPSANPDGVYKVIGKEGRFAFADVSKEAATVPGRFNAHDVDLNRNFDCRWKSESMWKGNKVSAGTEPFSEPEARAVRDFVLENKPDAVIFWHSQANAVYASECKDGILPKTLDIMNAYARAAGYPAVKSFDAYAITGDAEGWLASINIPAITVELKTHETIEWDKNLAGINALFKYYGHI